MVMTPRGPQVPSLERRTPFDALHLPTPCGMLAECRCEFFLGRGEDCLTDHRRARRRARGACDHHGAEPQRRGRDRLKEGEEHDARATLAAGPETGRGRPPAGGGVRATTNLPLWLRGAGGRPGPTATTTSYTMNPGRPPGAACRVSHHMRESQRHAPAGSGRKVDERTRLLNRGRPGGSGSRRSSRSRGTASSWR